MRGQVSVSVYIGVRRPAHTRVYARVGGVVACVGIFRRVCRRTYVHVYVCEGACTSLIGT